MEDQPLRISRRLQNLPPNTIVEPSPPPQRQRLDTDSSFEPVGISEVIGEPKLRTNQVDTTTVEIEELQAGEFAINFNSPLTDLNDPIIIQVLPFDSPMNGFPMSRIMASSGEGPSTPILAISTEGVPTPPVGTPKANIPATPLTPVGWVVQPLVSTNVVRPYCGVVTRIPSAPFSSPSFTHTA